MNPNPLPMNAAGRGAGPFSANKMAAGWLALALIVGVATTPVQAEPAPLQTVPSVDVPR